MDPFRRGLLQINNNITKGELFSINFLYMTQSPQKKRQHVNMLLGFRHKILQVYITQFRVCNQMYVSAVRIPVNLRLSEQEPFQLSVWSMKYRLVSTFSVSVEETESC